MASVKFINSRRIDITKGHSHNHIDIVAPTNFDIKPNRGTAVLHTDFEVTIGEDEVGLIQQQHNLSSDFLIILASTIVKSGYKGRLKVTLINTGDRLAHIKLNEPVAQLLILKSGSLKIEC